VPYAFVSGSQGPEEMAAVSSLTRRRFWALWISRHFPEQYSAVILRWTISFPH
jgi:hypothetical protein